jgi:hypothetical protein
VGWGLLSIAIRRRTKPRFSGQEKNDVASAIRAGGTNDPVHRGSSMTEPVSPERSNRRLSSGDYRWAVDADPPVPVPEGPGPTAMIRRRAESKSFEGGWPGAPLSTPPRGSQCTCSVGPPLYRTAGRQSCEDVDGPASPVAFSAGWGDRDRERRRARPSLRARYACSQNSAEETQSRARGPTSKDVLD